MQHILVVRWYSSIVPFEVETVDIGCYTLDQLDRAIADAKAEYERCLNYPASRTYSRNGEEMWIDESATPDLIEMRRLHFDISIWKVEVGKLKGKEEMIWEITQADADELELQSLLGY